MGERYTREMHEQYRKEQDEKAAKERQEHQERAAKETARRVWIRDGGRAEDFERTWPALRDQDRRRRVIDADREAREAQRRDVSRI